MHEVGIIAHSCGVSDPRELNRTHCRVVGDDGYSARYAAKLSRCFRIRMSAANPNMSYRGRKPAELP
jgi:hypothetical protein